MDRTAATRFAAALCLAVAAAGAPAAQLALEGSRLVVTGMLDGSGLPSFAEQVNSGRVRTVAFEDSVGGDAEVAEAYARLIRERKLLTEARGQCQAACAYAFLAGREHRFGRGPGFNALLIPLVRRPSTVELQAGPWRGSEAPPAAVEAVAVSAAAASTAPGPAAEPAAMAAPREAWQPGQGVVFTSTPTLFGRVYNTYWCDGSQGTDYTRCERLPDADPYKLGVLTP
ncbi:MAG: hypothetical protein EOP76_04560 [Variovorax sp.]|nr:MAG: hypothetical protein EOP76_04560 [Variovorax sp.]